MCGIVGVIHKNYDIKEKLFHDMVAEVSHRGPEHQGLWFASNKKVALGHRRLAIIDVSAAGNQPMQIANGRYTITFNGEIYNYRELKSELEKKGYQFKSLSDTEVLLNAYAEWGHECVKKLNGMFAFGIWDEEKKELFVARDHVGEKPLKYYVSEEKFIFASEIKAILKDDSVTREIDWPAIDLALSFRYVPSPYTGFKAIKKLPAGHYLIWKNGKIEITKYWFPETIQVHKGKSVDGWKTELWALFADSVKKRLMSDVPLGALLSGGLDSTSVVAAAHEVSLEKLNTFVISIGGTSKDVEYAEIAAKYFNTNHHSIVLEDIDFSSALSRLGKQYDEPFFDQAALPTMLISEAMKKEVTVVLSGDGGDELFGGYSSYAQVPFFRKISSSPKFLRVLLSHILRVNNKRSYQAEVLSRSFAEIYTEYYSLWKTSLPISQRYITKDDLYLPETRKKILSANASNLMQEWFFGKSTDVVNNVMLADIRGRLPDGYLAKVDFSAMVHAIETRPPFLDPRLVELSLSIPSTLKIQNGVGKHIWKETVKEKIPATIMNRAKAGFGIPLHSLMVDEMKGLVEDKIIQSGSGIHRYFSKKTIEKLWHDHKEGKVDYSNHLWSLLMLELWLNEYRAQ